MTHDRQPRCSRPTSAPITALLAAVIAMLSTVGAGCGATAQQPAPSSIQAAPATAAALSPTASPLSPEPSTAASPSASPAAATRFAFSVAVLSPARRAAMIESGSWSPRCPVSLDDLRLVSLTYWGFDARPHVGRLIVNQDAVTAVVGALRRLYDVHYPIRRMVPVDVYGANDERSMRADNTSAFNGRFVEGSTVWSQHAYGRAIDVDPLENPEIQDGKVYPATAGRFVDRTLGLPGMIVADDVVVRTFATVGWSWGGSWHSLKDYQHFSATGT